VCLLRVAMACRVCLQIRDNNVVVRLYGSEVFRDDLSYTSIAYCDGAYTFSLLHQWHALILPTSFFLTSLKVKVTTQSLYRRHDSALDTSELAHHVDRCEHTRMSRPSLGITAQYMEILHPTNRESCKCSVHLNVVSPGPFQPRGCHRNTK
jgi:hypothetical protein